jgi:translation elongation factor EF-Ts
MANTELIKKLRDLTQAGVMDAKKALDENGEDIEKAIQ